MPMYEFRCQHCNAVFEELCRVDEDGAALECPRCGGRGVTRLISVFTARGLENGHHGIGKSWSQSGAPRPAEGDSGGATCKPGEACQTCAGPTKEAS